ncbi:uncharacterized protein METZ01_LOCUS313166 [marine metagenome]|uniref:tRNA-binding domain-containing protein n=1 Tax=marine metagenome TaxID=408172 RepID=A0A382NKU9_9ZZZZ
MNNITWEEFLKVEIRVGTIIEINDFPEAIKPAYKIKVDLGEEFGIKQSSAQITDLYSKEDLINKQVVVVVNFPPKKIGSFISECLITGFYRNDKKVVLAVPDKSISNGSLLA